MQTLYTWLFLPMILSLPLYAVEQTERSTNIFALHEHELRQDTDTDPYEKEVTACLQNMKIEGLLHVWLLKGFKGDRKTKYAVLWLFKDEQSIHDNFGTI